MEEPGTSDYVHSVQKANGSCPVLPLPFMVSLCTRLINSMHFRHGPVAYTTSRIVLLGDDKSSVTPLFCKLFVDLLFITHYKSPAPHNRSNDQCHCLA